MDDIRFYKLETETPLRSGVAVTGTYDDGLVEAFVVIRGLEPVSMIRTEGAPREAVGHHLDHLLGEVGVELMEPIPCRPTDLEGARPLLQEAPIRGAFRELLRQTNARTLQRLQHGAMGDDWLH